MSDGNGVVDQMVFRWAGSRGAARGAGITAVAYSCDERVARDLAEQRGSVMRVKGGGERVSLVRLIHGGQAVLLRRMPEKDGNNRDSTVCHALMASAGALTSRRCLALGAGPWKEDKWFDSARGGIPGFALKDLQKLADQRQGPLRDGVVLVREPLARLVAELLREPGGRVSALIGELEAAAQTAAGRRLPASRADRADSDGGGLEDVALSALWALCDIFGGWLGHDGWTYATYDTSDHHPHRVVFVPDWRRSHVQDADLRRIRLTDVQQDGATVLAGKLVTHYCDWLATGSLDNYPRPLDRARDAAALPEEERYDRIDAALTGRPRRPHREQRSRRDSGRWSSDRWDFDRQDTEAEDEIYAQREAWQAPPGGPGSPPLPLPTGWQTDRREGDGEGIGERRGTYEADGPHSYAPGRTAHPDTSAPRAPVPGTATPPDGQGQSPATARPHASDSTSQTFGPAPGIADAPSRTPDSAPTGRALGDSAAAGPAARPSDAPTQAPGYAPQLSGRAPGIPRTPPQAHDPGPEQQAPGSVVQGSAAGEAQVAGSAAGASGWSARASGSAEPRDPGPAARSSGASAQVSGSAPPQTQGPYPEGAGPAGVPGSGARGPEAAPQGWGAGAGQVTGSAAGVPDGSAQASAGWTHAGAVRDTGSVARASGAVSQRGGVAPEAMSAGSAMSAGAGPARPAASLDGGAPSYPPAPGIPPAHGTRSAPRSPEERARAGREALDTPFLSSLPHPRIKWRRKSDSMAKEARVELVRQLCEPFGPRADDMRVKYRRRILQEASVPDLLLMLTGRLNCQAQNIVLRCLGERDYSESEIGELSKGLLRARLLLRCRPSDDDPGFDDELQGRAVEVAVWLFRWLVAPRAEQQLREVTEFLRDLVASTDYLDRKFLEDVLIPEWPVGVPELPGAALREVVRGLYHHHDLWTPGRERRR
ncbi:hypothetical protein ABZ490_31320 [Streptomyces sp. NPDC005811]|uniref:hypothetical protein n=1 Tax=Streptomyces sp. NPDC005811 TaxID=3154565 RepID=UPI0033F290BB